jgi:hypothetical protein
MCFKGASDDGARASAVRVRPATGRCVGRPPKTVPAFRFRGKQPLTHTSGKQRTTDKQRPSILLLQRKVADLIENVDKDQQTIRGKSVSRSTGSLRSRVFPAARRRAEKEGLCKLEVKRVEENARLDVEVVALRRAGAETEVEVEAESKPNEHD